jgi:hypothetical protein
MANAHVCHCSVNTRYKEVTVYYKYAYTLNSSVHSFPLAVTAKQSSGETEFRRTNKLAIVEAIKDDLQLINVAAKSAKSS